MTILTRVRWNLSIVWFASFLLPEKLNTASCIYWPFVPLPLRILYLIYVPIYSLWCWPFGGLVFWVPYWFQILVPSKMSSWQRFSPTLWAVTWVWWVFLLLCRSSLVWCSHISLFFLLDAEPFKFCLGNGSIYLYIPMYFLLLPGVLSMLQVL
jgi:hypothetical protein